MSTREIYILSLELLPFSLNGLNTRKMSLRYNTSKSTLTPFHSGYLLTGTLANSEDKETHRAHSLIRVSAV